MTKKVRVENADTSDWKVVVDIYDRKGPTCDPSSDNLVETRKIHYPTQLAELYIHSSRYLLVREV